MKKWEKIPNLEIQTKKPLWTARQKAENYYLFFLVPLKESGQIVRNILGTPNSKKQSVITADVKNTIITQWAKK